MCSNPAFSQQVRTTYQTTFCEIPSPHTFPSLATARKTLPSLTPAARVHWSRAVLTHDGMGTVRMWPPNQIPPAGILSVMAHLISSLSRYSLLVTSPAAETAPV